MTHTMTSTEITMPAMPSFLPTPSIFFERTSPMMLKTSPSGAKSTDNMSPAMAMPLTGFFCASCASGEASEPCCAPSSAASVCAGCVPSAASAPNGASAVSDGAALCASRSSVCPPQYGQTVTPSFSSLPQLVQNIAYSPVPCTYILLGFSRRVKVGRAAYGH